MSDRHPIVIDVRDSTNRRLPDRGQISPREPLPRLLSERPVRRRSGGWARPATRPYTRRPSNRWRCFRAAAIASPLALAGTLLIGGHHYVSPRRHSTSPPAVRLPVRHTAVIASDSAKAVDMPIPTGDTPAKPIRIVLDLTRQTIPAAERMTLGEWITTTQNASTRLRIEVGQKVSQPLSGRAWAQSGSETTTLARAAGIRWLEAGARRRTSGALIKLGTEKPPRRLSTLLRESWVDATPQILSVHRALAAAIARQIMITSHQGSDGPSRSS